jgi:hypothetical protein
MELRMLHFFRSTTASKLSETFSGDFWERRVMASAGEPSIRYGIIAITAIHQDYLLRHRTQGTVQDPDIRSFAFRQYTMAISQLHRLMTNGTTQLDITLMSCILFICFNCLSGNHDAAIIHLKAGLKILGSIKKKNREADRLYQDTLEHEWEQEFSPQLLALGVQVASFSKSNDRIDNSTLWEMLKDARLLTHPTIFHSIGEARYSLDTHITDIMADRAWGLLHGLTTGPYREESRQHIILLQRWRAAFDQFLETHTIHQPSLKAENAAEMLKIHYQITCLLVYTQEPSEERSEKRPEDMMFGAEHLAPGSIDGTYWAADIYFSTDVGVIAPLFFKRTEPDHSKTSV